MSEEKLPSGVDGFVSALRAVVDPRNARGLRHPLKAILAVCTCAVACGARSLEAIARWARDQPLEVRRRLGCRFGRPPSEPTIRRVLKSTGRSVEQVVHEWFAAQTVLSGNGVALDGKTLRGSLDGQGAHLASGAAEPCNTPRKPKHEPSAARSEERTASGACASAITRDFDGDLLKTIAQ